jgi:hypothetical protein
MDITHVLIFAASFLAGMIMVYLSPVEHKTIFVYPTPENVDKLQYKDSAGECFQFTSSVVPCKGGEREMRPQY